MFKNNHHRRGGWRRWISHRWESLRTWWWGVRRFWSHTLRIQTIKSTLWELTTRIWAGIVYPFWILQQVVYQSYKLFAAWWQIRNFRFLMRGIPALLAVLSILVIATYTGLRSDDGLQQLYLQTAQVAGGSDKETRLLCYERLVQIDSKHQPYLYGLAKACSDNGNYARSITYINLLADPDKPDGFAPAHIDKAFEILNRGQSRQNRLTQAEIELMERHLLRALRHDSNNDNANYLLGQLLLSSRPDRAEEAIRYLLKVRSYEAQTQAQTQIAIHYWKVGRVDEAKRVARGIMDTLQKKMETNLDDFQSRAALSDLHVIIGEFEQAIQVLLRGNELKKNPYYLIRVANIYYNWSESEANLRTRTSDARTAARNRIDLLAKCLSYDPSHFGAHAVLNELQKIPEQSKLVLEILSQQPNSDVLHFFLGFMYFREGKQEEALRHWKDAYELNPTMPIMANNYAWLLAFDTRRSTDLGQALRIIEDTLKITPTNSPYLTNLLGTKGIILMKYKYFDKAIPCFIDALKCAKDDAQRKEMHIQLSRAFNETGRRDQAIAHDKAAQELQNKENLKGRKSESE